MAITVVYRGGVMEKDWGTRIDSGWELEWRGRGAALVPYMVSYCPVMGIEP